MRLALAAMAFVTGCGGFLPFFGDDDEPAPAPAVVTDGGSETSTTVADASSTTDAPTEADAVDSLLWTCTTQGGALRTFTTEDDCNAARFADGCDAVSEPPVDRVPCEMAGLEQLYCNEACQKTAVGSSSYAFRLTSCACARQP